MKLALFLAIMLTFFFFFLNELMFLLYVGRIF